MVKRLHIFAALAAMSAANMAFASVVGASQPVFRHMYSIGQNPRVAIQNLYGNVTITAWDRNAVLVEAVKRSYDAKGSEDARIVVEPTSDSLSIRTQYAGSDTEHPTSVEYRITVPRGTNLESIVLTNGALTLSGLSGPIKASAVNGNIRAEKLGGQVELSTINGQVDADFERTSRGKTISLSSVNGPIRLSIPAGSSANLEAHNLSGGIATDVGRVARRGRGHHLMVKGGNGPQIHVQNVNGGISIHSTC